MCWFVVFVFVGLMRVVVAFSCCVCWVCLGVNVCVWVCCVCVCWFVVFVCFVIRFVIAGCICMCCCWLVFVGLLYVRVGFFIDVHVAFVWIWFILLLRRSLMWYLCVFG